MTKIQELLEKRANAWEQAKAFLDSHRQENGLISAEDNATYEKMETNIVAYGKEIERLQRQEAIDRELSAPLSNPMTSRPGKDDIHDGEGRASNAVLQDVSALFRIRLWSVCIEVQREMLIVRIAPQKTRRASKR